MPSIMNFTKRISVVLLMINSAFSVAQAHPTDELFTTDSTTWIKEIIKFPLGFAPEINYQGFEDLRFVKAGWGKQNHPEFWSYAFGWYLQTSSKPTLSDIVHNIQLYYDGLMQAVNKDPSFTVPKTIVSFKPIDEAAYVGTIKIYDSFYTKTLITLHVTVETHHCKAQDAYVQLFRVSLQEFEHEVWNKLNSLVLKRHSCD